MLLQLGEATGTRFGFATEQAMPYTAERSLHYAGRQESRMACLRDLVLGTLGYSTLLRATLGYCTQQHDATAAAPSNSEVL